MKETTEKAITSRSFDVVAAHFGLTCMPVPVNLFAVKSLTAKENIETRDDRVSAGNTKEYAL